MPWSRLWILGFLSRACNPFNCLQLRSDMPLKLAFKLHTFPLISFWSVCAYQNQNILWSCICTNLTDQKTTLQNAHHRGGHNICTDVGPHTYMTSQSFPSCPQDCVTLVKAWYHTLCCKSVKHSKASWLKNNYKQRAKNAWGIYIVPISNHSINNGLNDWHSRHKAQWNTHDIFFIVRI